MEEINWITGQIIKAAIKVHNGLGPGLLESPYEKALHFELTEEGLQAERQVVVPVVYRGIEIDNAYKADLIVENKVLVEIKSVEAILPVHKKQVLTYLRLNNLETGLLINFNVTLLKEGITRLFNNNTL